MITPVFPLKESGKEIREFSARLRLATALSLLFVSLLLARLASLQIIDYEHFTTLSHDNRLKIQPLPPARGLIYSREGLLLADNNPSFTLEVTPEKVKDINTSIAILRKLIALSDEEVERFQTAMTTKRRFDAVPLRVDLTEEEVAVFAANQHHFAGFNIAAKLSRFYPYADLTAHVVGYVGRISEQELQTIDLGNYAATSHIGKEGVEKTWENILHGRTGYQRVEVNAQGRVLRVVERTAPIPGKDVFLTLDLSLQRIAVTALGDNRGAIVALEPNTGNVVALVSKPAFDPNNFVNGISRALYRQLRDSPDRPLFNRALQGQYPPGSTIKPMMAAAGLEYAVRGSGDTIFCRGWYSLKGNRHRYRDWKKVGHGHVDLLRSIAESCDVYYYDLARQLGIDRIHEFLSRFGLGRPTGIDLPSERSGLLPSRAWKKRVKNLPWYPGETIINGIGQGFMLTSPLQLAQATSIIANRGAVIVPRVVGQLEDTVAHSAVDAPLHERERVTFKDPRHWQMIIAGMAEVVHGKRGTARRSGLNAKYRFAGKTGTAQLFGIAQGQSIDQQDLRKELRDHALFIAFAPVDNPELAVAILVENGESGSRSAAPIARTLFDHYFGVEPPPSDDDPRS